MAKEKSIMLIMMKKYLINNQKKMNIIFENL